MNNSLMCSLLIAKGASLAGLLVFASLLGCASGGGAGSDLTGRTIAAHQERDQVKVVVADRKRLAGMHTLSLSELAFGSDAMAHSGRQKRWTEQYKAIAGEELGLELESEKLAKATDSGSVSASHIGKGDLELRIVRAEERQGGQMGADQGAVASIGLILRDTKTKAIAWEGSYFYKDVALSDNLLGYGNTVSGKSAGGWTNLDEAVYTGIRAALKRLERDRLAAFSTRGS
jgi:hypothetical protein